MNIVDLIFPKICVGCGGEGEYICKQCQGGLIRPEPICPMCCKPSLDGWTHVRCRERYGMEKLIVGLPYRGLVQDCLKKVKYKSAWEIITFLCSLSDFEEVKEGFVTSVPMWRNKERERGFNQAQIIAKILAEKNNIQYLEILKRTRDTKPMFGLTRNARFTNIQNAFLIINNQIPIIKHCRVILVDDVWTTGATMRECARVLKKAGAQEVWGLTLAR